jgi:hypothetical protein
MASSRVMMTFAVPTPFLITSPETASILPDRRRVREVPSMRAILLLAIAAIPGLLPAQSFFELSTGDRCEGKVSGSAAISRIETAVGRLPLGDDVRVMRRDAFGPHENVALAEFALDDKNVAGQVAVAEYAAEQGIWTAARRHLNRALEAAPDDEQALALASKWADRFHLNAFEEGPKPNAHRALEAWLKEDLAKDWVGAAMVRAKVRGMRAADLLHPMIHALRTAEPQARWCAAQVLTGFRESPERIKPLYRRGILDASPVVRTECVRALKVTQDPVFAKLFAKSLASQVQAIRISAAQALAELEMPEGAEPIVRLLSGQTPVAPRNHFISTTQTAYVKDYDVQVAQNAVIADPIVDVVQDGVVLDVAVVSIQAEHRIYYAALRRMTKQDFGTDLAKWRAHLKIEPAGG